MGYLAQGNHIKYFILLENEKEFFRLAKIFKRTKKKRIKKKLAKRIDDLVLVEQP